MLSPRLTASVVSAALIIPLLASCVPGSSPEAAPGPTAEWASLAALDVQSAELVEAERELDALLAHHVGADEAWGVSAETAGERLPRQGASAAPVAGMRAPSSASPADYPVPQPDLETVGAAANSLSLLHQLLRDALGGAADDLSEHSASYDSGLGTNPAIEWSVERGVAAGSFRSSISDTNDAGDSVTVALDGRFAIAACPDEFGAAEGAFYTTAAVTFTPRGGSAVRTAIDIDMQTVTHVNDQAFAIDTWARLDSAVRSGAPDADSDTRVPEPESSRRDENAYAFEFGDEGVQGPGEVTVDEQLDGAFSVQVDDLAEQIALLIARAAEDFWRDGSCVEVVVEGEDVTPRPGDRQQLWVDAVSTVDGQKITSGTVEVTRVLGDSTINPLGPQPIEEADYQFIAGQEFGHADPDFEVVSKRGIGRGGTGITIVGDVWVLDGAFDSAIYTGLSCDGIRGPWELVTSVPMIGETWSTQLLFDENLEVGFTAPPTNGGEWVHPDTRFWLEPNGDGYIMHNEPEDAALGITRGDPALCG